MQLFETLVVAHLAEHGEPRPLLQPEEHVRLVAGELGGHQLAEQQLAQPPPSSLVLAAVQAHRLEVGHVLLGGHTAPGVGDMIGNITVTIIDDALCF